MPARKGGNSSSVMSGSAHVNTKFSNATVRVHLYANIEDTDLLLYEVTPSEGAICCGDYKLDGCTQDVSNMQT